MRPRTKQIYEGQSKHITPTFAGVSLCDIRPIDVRGWRDQLSSGQLHQNTIAKIYRLFRTYMSTAVEDDLLRQNPVRIKGAMIERPLLTWDDVRALAGAIHPRFEFLVWTAAASGLRFGELAGLSIDRVNLDISELRVSRALNDIKGVGPTLSPPKTDRAVRTVAIPEAVALRLVVHIEQFVDDAQSDSLVFTSLRGGPLLNTYFAPRWSNARSEVGLPPCALPRSPTSCWPGSGNRGRLASLGDGDDGPRAECRVPPLTQSIREPLPRNRRRHRPTDGRRLTSATCATWYQPNTL